MVTLREAAQQALDALQHCLTAEWVQSCDGIWTQDLTPAVKAVTALRHALESEQRDEREGWDGMTLVGYWHQADDPDECDFYYADAINGDCPQCSPCYTKISKTTGRQE